MQPFAYERINETTWMYVSTFLILSFFFKFNRAWSIRNLDLFLIILLAPGLLMIQSGRVQHSQFMQSVEQTSPQSQPDSQATPVVNQASFSQLEEETVSTESESEFEPAVTPGESELGFAEPGLSRQRWGYYWMFGIGGLIMLRMLVDPLFERRPVLDPNLSIGGMVFLGLSMLIFVLANVATYSPGLEEIEGAKDAENMFKLRATDESEDGFKKRGPGYRLLYLLPVLSTFENSEEIRDSGLDPVLSKQRYIIASKIVAIISQILIVLALILFCYYHYRNFHVGVGIATIYMMLPYTVIFTGNVLHTVPAALLLWALVCYRVPWAAGIFVGLATGVSYYPLFLLALWISYYWDRGWRSFLVGFFISIAVCIFGLVFTSVDEVDFFKQLQAMFAFWFPRTDNLEGIWALGLNDTWRIPLLVAFVAISSSFAAWPTEKNIGTLVAYTAALMAAVQFWHGFGGGLYVAWYLPLALLVMFRPNVSGRVATTDVIQRSRRKIAEAVT